MSCPFCSLPPARIVAANTAGFVVRDVYPVSPGHTLIISRRHVVSFFDLSDQERAGMLSLLDLEAFTLEPTTLKVLVSEHALSGSRGMTGELRHHGQDMLIPVRQDDKPGRAFLDWNWKNVFKREARSSRLAD